MLKDVYMCVCRSHRRTISERADNMVSRWRNTARKHQENTHQVLCAIPYCIQVSLSHQVLCPNTYSDHYIKFCLPTPIQAITPSSVSQHLFRLSYQVLCPNTYSDHHIKFCVPTPIQAITSCSVSQHLFRPLHQVLCPNTYSGHHTKFCVPSPIQTTIPSSVSQHLLYSGRSRTKSKCFKLLFRYSYCPCLGSYESGSEISVNIQVWGKNISWFQW